MLVVGAGLLLADVLLRTLTHDLNWSILISIAAQEVSTVAEKTSKGNL